MDDELNIDPRETDYFDDYDMEKMGNFFELEKQLAALGFDDPALIQALRQRITTTDNSIFTVNYREMTGGNEFRAWFEYEQRGVAAFSLAHFEAMLSVGKDDLHRLFATDITREEAIAVLHQDQRGFLPDEETLRPMNRAQVNACLQLLGNPQQAIEQFKAAGLHHWNDPDARATLALPHGPFYQADEYNMDGRRLLTELELGGNHHQLRFKQITVHLLPDGFNENIDNPLYLPFTDLVPEHTISQKFDRLVPLTTIYEQLIQRQMQQAINFYELKTQLQDLGFHDPVITDELRGMVAADKLLHDIFTQQDGADFTLSFQKDNSALQLYCIDASMDIPGKTNNQVMQYFQPDVPVVTATELLRLSLFIKNDHDPFMPLNLQATQQYIHELKSNSMNTQNLSYLQKQLLNLGFGEGLNKDLEQQISTKPADFTLDATNEYNKQNVDYKLHFKAGDKDEMYFFNKYDASLNDTKQTFYINKGSGITAKEAYNLMEGRAVHKQLENLEGEKYNAWLIIDKENKTENGNFKLRPFTEGWNYRPEKAIDMMDIVGIKEEGARDKLMKSLEKGNRHQVTAMKDGKEVKLFIEANPAEHRVNLTNWKGEAQQLEHYKKPELKQAAKQAQAPEDGAKKKQSRGKKISV